MLLMGGILGQILGVVWEIVLCGLFVWWHCVPLGPGLYRLKRLNLRMNNRRE